ncbi:MAG TPA: hypothetical protein PKL56_13980 [Cyclobacteriaceae bacterium]|nr:hypothetical protein [Cyclobacteriaceae bacterium]HMV07601.1 hypothetical protein [Cyclobacteriaceae bacterium]HMV89331.1 hypothetical protein [Cyclobacteriaceae bacterium]HMW98736.1 hypothetical protein [Cyclobacteriaceae bacterium]HMX48630.1 hypothetical protein [Cyclobacteriaceae bacterium]
MAKANSKAEKGLTPKEKIDLQSDMKKFGYLLPTNEEEEEEFNKLFGKTKVIFPEHLKRPKFLTDSTSENFIEESRSVVVNNLSVEERKPLKGKNDYFKKLVLAAEIADQLHGEPTFGHVKFVKVYMLCDKVCNMGLSSQYRKFAAGPLDPKQMYMFDAEFKKKKWFKVSQRSGGGYQYSPDENLDEYRVWYQRYFKNQTEAIALVIELFRKKTSDFCEIVATVFFVWAEHLSQRKILSDSSLILDFYEWDERKKRFKEEEIKNAIRWMEENRIYPII